MFLVEVPWPPDLDFVPVLVGRSTYFVIIEYLNASSDSDLTKKSVGLVRDVARRELTTSHLMAFVDHRFDLSSLISTPGTDLLEYRNRSSVPGPVSRAAKDTDHSISRYEVQLDVQYSAPLSNKTQD